MCVCVWFAIGCTFTTQEDHPLLTRDDSEDLIATYAAQQEEQELPGVQEERRSKRKASLLESGRLELPARSSRRR